MLSDIPQSDLKAIATTRTPEQYKASTRLLATLDAFLDELIVIQTTLLDAMRDWNLDDATGVPLDVIGEIVGILRPRIQIGDTLFFNTRDVGTPDATLSGTSDLATTPYLGGVLSSTITPGASPQVGPPADGYPMVDFEYRLHIRLQIKRSHQLATGDDALEAIDTVLPTPLDPIDPTLVTYGGAALITFGRRVEAQEIERFKLDIVREPVGVRLSYAHVDDDVEDAFGWDEIGTPGNPFEGWVDLTAPTVGAGIWATLIPGYPF